MFEFGDKVRVVDGSFYDIPGRPEHDVTGLTGTVVDEPDMPAEEGHAWVALDREGNTELYFKHKELEKVEA